MIWGEATLDWDKLATVCEKLKCYHYLRSTLGITTSDISFLFRRFVEPDEKTYHANRFNFVYELQRARHLKFSDDRDRIFAFLGHFSISSHHPLSCGPLSITTDYTKTAEETYVNTAIQILQQSPASLCIVLSAVQHAQKRLPSTMAETEMWVKDKNKLPSWVPDWRWSEGIILAEPICPHHAHGGFEARMTILEEPDLILQVHGVQIDAIKRCSSKLTSGDFYIKKSHQSLTTIERLWMEICGKSEFDLSDSYISSEAAFFAFMQTLSNGCVQAAGHECTPYHEVLKAVWLCKAARYLIDTHQVSSSISKEIETVGEMAASESNWDRWATSASAGRVFATTEKGYYVLGPSPLEEGDIVCVLFGCKVPFCLRPMGGRYLLVGECYVHGIMDGEAMDMLARNELQGRVFDIV